MNLQSCLVVECSIGHTLLPLTISHCDTVFSVGRFIITMSFYNFGAINTNGNSMTDSWALFRIEVLHWQDADNTALLPDW